MIFTVYIAVRSTKVKDTTIAFTLKYYINVHALYVLSVVGGCPSDPCINGGICVPDLTQSYTCNCPDGYTGRICHEFPAEQSGFRYLINHVPKTWDDARVDCENRGYYLASISSTDELAFLGEIIT